MGWSIDLAPLIDWRLIAALGAAAALISLIGLLRRVPGAWLRALAAALLVLTLLDPSLRQEERDALPGVVALVVDRSTSQTLGERRAETDAARAEIETRLSRLRGLETRLIEVGDSADGTAPFDALERGLADVPAERIAGALLLTDGQVHDVPERAAQLGFNAPVHVLLTGQEDEADRRLVLQSSPRFGIVGEEQPVSFRVEDSNIGAAGRGGDGTVAVTVRRDGEVVAELRATPGSGVTVPVEIAHGGRNVIEIEVEEAPQELTALNNRAVVFVEGIRENLRVLLVSGEPHAGERTWRNILKSDAAVDLVHFTILRPPEKQDGTPISQLSLIAFPTRELFSVKIDEFDLIIFDRYQSRGVLPVLYYDNIARYVEAGGAVLVAAGPEYAENGSLFRTPLAPVLPAAPTGAVIEAPYRAMLSEAGERHPITRDLDEGAEEPGWSRWFRLVESADPQGQTLLTGAEERPLLVVEREGEGRVAVLLSDHAWLWARGFEGGGPYVPLLRRLAHWLMKESDLEEEALSAFQEGGSLVVERQTMAETVGPAQVTMPGGEIQELILEEVEPGRFRAGLPVEQQGIYRVRNDDLSAVANVGPENPREFADVRSTGEVLAPLVEETGGGIFRVAEDGAVEVPRVLPVRAAASFHGDGWLGLRQTDATVLRGIRAMPVLAGLLGLVLLLAALTAAWYREGR